MESQTETVIAGNENENKPTLTQKEYNKLYYEENKKKIIRCDTCKMDVPRYNIYKHNKSQLHNHILNVFKPNQI